MPMKLLFIGHFRVGMKSKNANISFYLGGITVSEQKGTKTISVNRQARHEYFVEESMETGIELKGTEVKSLRQGTVNLKDSWCDIDLNGEVYIKQMHISPYEMGNIFNVDPIRPRKLLLHKSEISRLIGLVQRQGYTLIPLSLYFKNSRVKVQLGI